MVCAGLPARAETLYGYDIQGTFNWSALPGQAVYAFPGATTPVEFNVPGWEIGIDGPGTNPVSPAGNVTLDVALDSTDPVRLDIQAGGTLTNAFNGSTSFNQPFLAVNQAVRNWGTINVPVGNLGMFTNSNDSSVINEVGGNINLSGTGGITFNNYFDNQGTLTLAGATDFLSGQTSSHWTIPNFTNTGTLQGGGIVGAGFGGDIWMTNITNGIIDANTSDPLVLVTESSPLCSFLAVNFNVLECGVQNEGGTVEVQTGDTLRVSGGDYTQTSGLTKVQGLFTSNGNVNITGGILGTKGGTVTSAHTTVSGTGVLKVGDPATTTINGAFTLGAGGTIDMVLDGPSLSDQDHIDFTGSADLSQGTVVLDIPLNVDLNGLSLSLFTFGAGQTGGSPTFSFLNGQNYSVVEQGGMFEFSGNTVGGGASTPEPGTFAVLLAGLLLVGVRAYRLSASRC